MEEVPNAGVLQKPLNNKVFMTEILPDHPYFLLLKNFQNIISSGSEIPLEWIHSCCLYHSEQYEDMFKTHLHIALAERLTLFGKDPKRILEIELDGDKLLRLPEHICHQLERAFVSKLLATYQLILRG